MAFGYSYEPSAERGDPNYRRTTNIDVNQVRSTIYNWGYTGKTAVYTGYGYEWPVNSGNEYIWLTGLAVGAQIQSESGDSSLPSKISPTSIAAVMGGPPISQLKSISQREASMGVESPSLSIRSTLFPGVSI